ncbi:MAG: protease complex subunit PrcB family protein [Rhodocyclales bacterium]|nr:protease complex subunit PrcB family protein [Rhodocyclales bacterium]
MKKTLKSSLLVTMLASSAAASAAAPNWPIVEIATQSQCPWLARNATAHIFENEAQWARIYPTTEPSRFGRSMNWSQHVVVGLTLGARPTAGYAIELNDKQFELRGDTLWLGFHERAPAAGEIREEVVTQPCIFIVTKRGDWRRAVLQNIDSGKEFKDELSNIPPIAPGAVLIKAVHKRTNR